MNPKTVPIETLQFVQKEFDDFKARAYRIIEAYKLEIAELKRAGDTYQADVQGFYPSEPEKPNDH